MPRARKGVQRLHAGIADAALGLVDDALEGQVVIALRDQAQIGHGIADFLPAHRSAGRRSRDRAGPSEMKRSSNSRIWNEARTSIAICAKLLPWRCRSSASRATLRASSSASHTPCDLDLLAGSPSVHKRLAQPALVGGDQAGGRAQDGRRGAVIALQPDDLGAGEIALEAQDVFHLRAAPAIDGLVVVAHHADIAATPARPAASATDTGRHWCPDIRPPACSGSGRDNRPGCRAGSCRMCSISSSRSPKSAAFSAFSRS